MPRIPRKWAASFHPQAARSGNQLSYRPGWNGTGQQPMQRLPVGAYTQKATGVPLTGGQNQGTVPGVTATGTGTLTSPAAFSGIATATFPVTGTYTVTWTVTLSGTLSPTETNNFQLFKNASVFEKTSVNPDTAGTYPQASFTMTANAGDQLDLTNPLAATSGAVYGGTVTVTQQPAGTLTLTAGPQGLGTTWYPAQVTLSTTTGPLDTSTALIYLGAQGVPITLVGSVFTGNGTAALAIPSMSPGQVLIVTWTNAHPGDTAAFNIVGTMDALTTG